MANILVAGSLALDYIGTYPGSFATTGTDSNLDQSFTLTDLDVSFGGCAMNIAVGLHKIGHNVLPFALTSKSLDQSYAQHLRDVGLRTDCLVELPEYSLPSQCFIVTDGDGHQLTAFYPGPGHSTTYRDHLEHTVKMHVDELDCAILAPDIGRNMLDAIEICLDHKIPFLSDPGQCLNDFTLQQTQLLVRHSSLLCVNAHEHDLLRQRIGLPLSISVVIQTRGRQGAILSLHDKQHPIPAIPPNALIDSTGCGDAFRVGLVHGRLLGFSWTDACRLGSKLASIALETNGSQAYSVEGIEAFASTLNSQVTQVDIERVFEAE